MDGSNSDAGRQAAVKMLDVIPWEVIDDHGCIVPGPVTCGRSTASGSPCANHRAHLSAACWHHVTLAEKAAATLASSAQQYQNLERQITATGASMADPEVRRQFRDYIDRDRMLFASKLGEGPRPDPISQEQLDAEPITAMFAKKHVGSRGKGYSRDRSVGTQ